MVPLVFKGHDWELPGSGQFADLQEINHFSGHKSLKIFLLDSFLSHKFCLRTINLTSRDSDTKQERGTKVFLIPYADLHSIICFLDVPSPCPQPCQVTLNHILLGSTSPERRGVIWQHRAGKFLYIISNIQNSLYISHLLFSPLHVNHVSV